MDSFNRAVRGLINAIGMHWENMDRFSKNQPITYKEKDFKFLADNVLCDTYGVNTRLKDR